MEVHKCPPLKNFWTLMKLAQKQVLNSEDPFSYFVLHRSRDYWLHRLHRQAWVTIHPLMSVDAIFNQLKWSILTFELVDYDCLECIDINQNWYWLKSIKQALILCQQWIINQNSIDLLLNYTNQFWWFHQNWTIFKINIFQCLFYWLITDENNQYQ